MLPKGDTMKSKLLNPLQSLMSRVCEQCADLLAQNANCACYHVIRTWFSDTVILYALTVASGNDTYLKQALYNFDNHIVSECENKTRCNDISTLLGDMITLLTA